MTEHSDAASEPAENYGPVEVLVLAFPETGPGPAVAQAVAQLADVDSVRLLDLVFVSRSAEGEVSILEWDEFHHTAPDDFEAFRDIMQALDLAAHGLTGETDVADLAPLVTAGSSAAILVVEMLWAKDLAATISAGGGAIRHVETIPAAVVNEIVAEASGL